MELVDKIISYLTNTYNPSAMILYGSFADGSANENSDFDALIIADHAKTHDSSVIDNTVLDVFVYPMDTFQPECPVEEFIQVFDGKILMDKNGAAERLQKRVLDYIDRLPLKPAEELRQEIEWCGKMLSRTLRGDPEGYYRWHWLLCDSLEIYCDIKRAHYFGPKKALRHMARTDPEAFALYSLALKELSQERLAQWISFLKSLPAAPPTPKGVFNPKGQEADPASGR